MPDKRDSGQENVTARYRCQTRPSGSPGLGTGFAQGSAVSAKFDPFFNRRVLQHNLTIGIAQLE